MKWIRPILPMLLFLLCADLGWTQAQEASVVRDPPPPYLPDPNNQFDLTTSTAVAKGHPWLELPPIDYQPPPYARYLRGLRICLDPGHGGYQHVKGYKATASGYEEAVMNLTVAKHLRDWLLKSGVTVVMTRDDNYDIRKKNSDSLAARPQLATLHECDLFISMHHNAHSRKDANFPSAFYHADPGNIYSNVDLGKAIVNELEYWMRLPEYAHTGLYSDYLMYDGAGFGVLRGARVPAILIEASFFSNPEEEARLRDPEYLKRQAWAYYMGLAKYVRDGLPRAELVYPADGILDPAQPRVEIQLRDGCPEGWGAKGPPRIIRHSIQLDVSGYSLPFEYNEKLGILTWRADQVIPPGEYEFSVRYINMRKNSNLPTPFKITMRP